MDNLIILLLLGATFTIYALVFLFKQEISTIFAQTMLLATICGTFLSFFASFLLILYLSTWIFIIKFVSSYCFYALHRYNQQISHVVSLTIASQFVDFTLLLSVYYILIL